MYFQDRREAGRLLGEQLLKEYRYENNMVLCLGDGAVPVGDEIAAVLHCTLNLLLSHDIKLPGELGATLGSLDSAGDFVMNDAFSKVEVESFLSDYHNYVEQEKMHAMHSLNEAYGYYGVIDRHVFTGHNVILVSDGLKVGTPVIAANEYLKPVRTGKLVAAVPFASVGAIDTLHIHSDRIVCLDVKANYLDTNHYYEANDIPDPEAIKQMLSTVTERWR